MNGDFQVNDNTKKWKVNSVAKAMSLLDQFSEEEPELSLAQLSSRANTPKTTVFNLVKTLEDGEFLRKSDFSQNYLLGLKLFEMGYWVKNSLSIISYAIPLMEEVMRETGEITYLSSVYKDKILILEGVYPQRRDVAYAMSGRTRAMHCCSAGKAMLAYLPKTMVDRILNHCGMPPHTSNTITDPIRMHEELERIRQRGYSTDMEEESYRVRCASVTIRDYQGVSVGAISISGTVRAMTEEKIQRSIPALEKASRFLSQKVNMFPAVYMED